MLFWSCSLFQRCFNADCMQTQCLYQHRYKKQRLYILHVVKYLIFVTVLYFLCMIGYNLFWICLIVFDGAFLKLLLLCFIIFFQFCIRIITSTCFIAFYDVHILSCFCFCFVEIFVCWPNLIFMFFLACFSDKVLSNMISEVFFRFAARLCYVFMHIFFVFLLCGNVLDDWIWFLGFLVSVSQILRHFRG